MMTVTREFEWRTCSLLLMPRSKLAAVNISSGILSIGGDDLRGTHTNMALYS
jgi:hypothetical protein